MRSNPSSPSLQSIMYSASKNESHKKNNSKINKISSIENSKDNNNNNSSLTSSSCSRSSSPASSTSTTLNINDNNQKQAFPINNSPFFAQNHHKGAFQQTGKLPSIQNMMQAQSVLLPPPPPPPPLPSQQAQASSSQHQMPASFGAKQLNKLKRFLTTLQQFAADISPEIGDRVRNLILCLIVSNSINY